jgi:hypothetical protein
VERIAYLDIIRELTFACSSFSSIPTSITVSGIQGCLHVYSSRSSLFSLTVDGFYVAKFKVNKKTKAQKAPSGGPSNEVEMELDSSIVEEKVVVPGQQNAKFSNEEDEALIRGTLCPRSRSYFPLLTRCSCIDSKRQALKAKGIKLSTDSPAAKSSSKKPSTDSPTVPKKTPKEKSRPRPAPVATKKEKAAAAAAALPTKKVSKTTAA